MTILSIHRKPSRRLTIILCMAHFITAGLIEPLALPLGINTIVIVILIISLVYYLKRDALLTANNAIVVLELSEKMQCTLTTRSGESQTCTILNSTFVAPYLTVLDLQLTDKFLMRSVVIFPDSIDTEEFRRLRVLLRWKWKDSDKIG